VVVLLVGLLSSRRNKGDVASYFMASRSMHWIPVGASLYASNVGSGLFVGLAGTGAASGIAIAAFELNATFVLMLLGWLFVPVYLSAGVYTMPEYLRERFGGRRIRIYLSVLSLLLYVFTKISSDLFAGALFIQEAVGKSSQEWLYISCVILLAISALFTMVGGLTAVIWTDFIQTIIMVLGALTLTGIAFHKVGGYEALVQDYPYTLPAEKAYDEDGNLCNAPTPWAFHLMRPVDDDLPWTGIMFGLTVLAVWCWCTDQVIVQRTLASRSLTHAKAGCVLGGALKVLPLWMLVFPGMISRVLFPDSVGCSAPSSCEQQCGSEQGCSNLAYVKLVMELLPSGLRGLMLAVMMAALMSSLTSIFNSASTIFTVDIWSTIRAQAWARASPRAVEVEKLIVGRVSVLVLVVVSVLWIPVIQTSSNSQLFVYIQSITSFLAPPLTAVFVLAVFWRRTNEPGAFWGLMLGLVVGLVRFIVEFSYVVPPCGSGTPDPRPPIVLLLVGRVNYLHFSILLLLLSGAVTVCVSLLTRPIPEQCLHRLTFWTRFSSEPRCPVDHREEKAEEPNGKPDRHVLNVTEEAQKESSQSVKLLALLCCTRSLRSGDHDITAGITPDESPADLAKGQVEQALQLITEDPDESRLVSAAAVVVAVATVFLWGFYA